MAELPRPQPLSQDYVTRSTQLTFVDSTHIPPTNVGNVVVVSRGRIAPALIAQKQEIPEGDAFRIIDSQTSDDGDGDGVHFTSLTLAHERRSFERLGVEMTLADLERQVGRLFDLKEDLGTSITGEAEEAIRTIADTMIEEGGRKLAEDGMVRFSYNSLGVHVMMELLNEPSLEGVSDNIQRGEEFSIQHDEYHVATVSVSEGEHQHLCIQINKL